jgi:ubiquinone/menaquinone biosynthesis C-methylase UbiE
LAKEQNTQNVEFLVGDVKDLKDLEPELFDIVHANQVLLTLSNPLDVMREMRRLTKPGGIVSTRDNAHRAVVPPIPGLMKNLETFYRFSASKGADPNFGLRSHVVAHEAGFNWEDIEMSSWASEESSKEGKALYVQGAKDVSRAALINSNLATPEETDEHSRAWDEWAQRPDGRFMTLNGALLCWKRDTAV